jgi:hypothetical protein
VFSSPSAWPKGTKSGSDLKDAVIEADGTLAGQMQYGTLLE